MKNSRAKLILFTDLDGCLLNKADYDWSAAASVLKRLERHAVPVVLSSSKTAAEMAALVQELHLPEAPLISENGGVLHWPESLRPQDSAPEQQAFAVTSRTSILQVLTRLKDQFQFRSFVDLGVEGVMATTDLPRAEATLACQRESTEPLLWDDTEEKILTFRILLLEQKLTLTRGGRFWHVAGPSTKGRAMQQVVQRYRELTDQQFETVAIGDSPNDQSMLDIADYPIGIPSVSGRLGVQVSSKHGIVASTHGATGWAEAVGQLLDRLGFAA